MPHQQTIQAVRSLLREVSGEVDPWFDRPIAIRVARAPGGGWSIEEVLEHVTLTNHDLMLTLRKYAEIALRRAAGASIPEGESDLERLEVIGRRGSFEWTRPEHMEPTGQLASAELRATMGRQFGECLAILERLEGGEGSLCRITMTVAGLGKIDLYQWLAFLAQHARRHVQQMAEIEEQVGSPERPRIAEAFGPVECADPDRP